MSLYSYSTQIKIIKLNIKVIILHLAKLISLAGIRFAIGKICLGFE